MTKSFKCVCFAGALALTCACSSPPQPAGAVDAWPSYGRDPGGMRHSPLTEINRDNVSQLTVAWIAHTGDISDGSSGRQRSGFETTPIVVDGTLYLTTPTNRVLALDPETGVQRWAYDPKIDPAWSYGDGLTNRGVATWLDESQPTGQPCHRRVFEATLDARLLALDAATGKPCADFGNGGAVNLTDVPGYQRGVYHMTSPPAIIDDLVIVGSAINDNTRVDLPAGVVRAYDARTGTTRWKWDPISPNPASGAANAWSITAGCFDNSCSRRPACHATLRPGVCSPRWT